MSNEKKGPSCLGFFWGGWKFLPNYVGEYFINNQDFMESTRPGFQLVGLINGFETSLSKVWFLNPSQIGPQPKQLGDKLPDFKWIEFKSWTYWPTRIVYWMLMLHRFWCNEFSQPVISTPTSYVMIWNHALFCSSRKIQTFGQIIATSHNRFAVLEGFHPRLFQANLGWWNIYSIWPETSIWKKPNQQINPSTLECVFLWKMSRICGWQEGGGLKTGLLSHQGVWRDFPQIAGHPWLNGSGWTPPKSGLVSKVFRSKMILGDFKVGVDFLGSKASENFPGWSVYTIPSSPSARKIFGTRDLM